ncbi:MAG: DUF2127 domain-containing protein [Bacillota bacterium]|nr:DUF2127 domain-containing protein [Bacillota bacterium]
MKKNYLVHLSFKAGLVIKGIDGLLEIIGGTLLLFFKPYRLSKLVYTLTLHELSEDPKDKLANLLVTLSHSLSISTMSFTVFYLVSHGIVKCVLIILLLWKKPWAYPLAIVSLILFIVYQIYRYTFSHSLFLLILTFLDIAMTWLTYLEYKNIKYIKE